METCTHGQTLTPPSSLGGDHTRGNNDGTVEERLRLTSTARWDHGGYYNWKTYFPHEGGIFSCLQWFRSGYGGDKAQETDADIRNNLHHLATMLKLLREYYHVYGLPENGGPKEQEYVLREILTALYGGGVPIWTLEPAMERGAEGLTGKKGVGFCVFPRTAFIFAPSSGATSMFRVARNFDIQKLTGAERVLVRIASYASNTHGFSSRPSRLPDPNELIEAERQSSLTMAVDANVSGVSESSKQAMATLILSLASKAEGLFYFINSSDRPETSVSQVENGTDEINRVQQFWKVEANIAELFSRLATIEALHLVNDLAPKRQYPIPVILLFRFAASAGACVFWFNGGWIDCLVAGACGSLVGLMSRWNEPNKEESMIFEAIASLLVGLIAGVVSLLYPTHTCFGAMGVAGIIDVLQGFRVVYAVLELMSKHSVSGSSDFLEGLLYTGLIAYCLKVGQLVAVFVTGQPTVSAYVTCNNRVHELWDLLLVPAASIAWSGLFNPDYCDLPWMAFHGVLAFFVIWVCKQGKLPPNFGLFFAALFVTFSSGIFSRFTGRQAMGNTVAGLYVLVPGAFLVESLLSDLSFDFMGPVILNAAIIGTGAWAGTVLCSPIILGTTATLLKKRSQGRDTTSAQREISTRDHCKGAMLFF